MIRDIRDIDIEAREKAIVHAAEVWRLAEHSTPHGFDPTCPPSCAKHMSETSLVRAVDDLRQARAIAALNLVTTGHSPGGSESR